MESFPIYLDNNSTTRVDPRVVNEMLPFFSEHFGNASSVTHAYGNKAAVAVENARDQIAKLLNTPAKEVHFTSGATESNNLALQGVMRAATPAGHLIINAAEHKAVIDPAEQLRREGFEVSILGVDKSGRVEPDAVANAIRPNTVLVSVMLANNEVGTVNPIREIGEICSRNDVLLHTDATQAVGRLPIDLASLPVDLLSLSAHKMYGPKGIGALIVRKRKKRIKIVPLVDGGGHERKLRSGTLPVQQIVGLGVACEICRSEMPNESSATAKLRDTLRTALESQVDEVTFNGSQADGLPGTLHATFHGVNSDALMAKLKDVVALSSGSACTTADPEPSHVLVAMGIDENDIDCSIRFGLGRFNTLDEVNLVSTAIASAVKQLKQLSASF